LRDPTSTPPVSAQYLEWALQRETLSAVAREGVPLTVVQRQLGHANLGIRSIYLQGIDNSEIINTVLARPASTLPQPGLR
jgi:integrase/recombinase XerD